MLIRKKLSQPGFGSVLFEIFLVVLAVLFALGVNEWRTNLANEDLAESALNYIIEEVKKNKTEIEDSIEEHDAVITDLQAMLAHGMDTTASSVNFGYTFSVLGNTAWHSTLATEAVRYLDFETVQSLSELYELQQLYSDHGKNVFREMGSVAYHREGTSRAFLRSNLFNLHLTLNIERSLVAGYEEFLSQKTDRSP